jgi:alkanesulfonate monooxygenase SsuD/methylene tetrahydromethanopterin reductase-like flavin-dependent oxidoreductase (luciferase family)
VNRSVPPLKLGLGIFSLQSVPRHPDHHARIYRNLIDDAQLAESLGFESLWLSEHHFWFDGYCPADLAVAGSVLSRTSKLRVGTAVLLLPLHSAAKVADDARTLSRLSDGRIALGVGLGYRDEEFDGFGLLRKERGKSMDRLLPRLVELCAEVGVPPIQVSVAAASSVAADRAGRLGLPVFADSTMTADELTEMMARYSAAAGRAGVAEATDHILQRDVFVSEDPERDWDLLFPELRYMRRQYGGWSLPQASGESDQDHVRRLESDIEAKLRNLIFGRPEEVAAQLEKFHALGFELIVCRSQYGNVPRDLFHRAVTSLGRVREMVAR